MPAKSSTKPSPKSTAKPDSTSRKRKPEEVADSEPEADENCKKKKPVTKKQSKSSKKQDEGSSDDDDAPASDAETLDDEEDEKSKKKAKQSKKKKASSKSEASTESKKPSSSKAKPTETSMKFLKQREQAKNVEEQKEPTIKVEKADLVIAEQARYHNKLEKQLIENTNAVKKIAQHIMHPKTNSDWKDSVTKAIVACLRVEKYPTDEQLKMAIMGSSTCSKKITNDYQMDIEEFWSCMSSEILATVRNKRNRWTSNVKLHVKNTIKNWETLTKEERIQEFQKAYSTEGALCDLVRLSFALPVSAAVCASDKSFAVLVIDYYAAGLKMGEHCPKAVQQKVNDAPVDFEKLRNYKRQEEQSEEE